jgi:hypothetical protein
MPWMLTHLALLQSQRLGLLLHLLLLLQLQTQMQVSKHAREVEYTTEQTDSAHARVDKTLWPRLGDEETINDEVAFGGVKMGAANSSADAAAVENCVQYGRRSRAGRRSHE